MITVHHLSDSRSQRVLWLLEELGLSYEVKRYERDPLTLRAPSSLRTVHPLGHSPIMTDGDLTLAESGAITEYLVTKYGSTSTHPELAPAASRPEWIKYLYWLHYAEGSLMTPLLLKLIFSRMPKSAMPFFMLPLVKKIANGALSGFVNPQLKTHMDFLEAELEKSHWFAGDAFTAADILLSFPIECAVQPYLGTPRYPRLQSYLTRIHQRPAYINALAKGGPFQIPE